MIIITKLAILASGAALAALIANNAIDHEKIQAQQNKLVESEKQLREQAQTDRAIAGQLNQRLFDSGVGAHNDIDIRVYKRVAYLSGYANTEQEKQEAVEVIEDLGVAVNDRDLRYIVDLPKVMVRAQRVDPEEGQAPIAVAAR